MVNHCLNPDCQKRIPKDHNYCDEICLRWHIKIKGNNYFNVKLKPNPKSIVVIPDRCQLCGKIIRVDNYLQYHSLWFCSLICCREYKETEVIIPDKSLPFMEYVRSISKKVLVNAT